MSNWGFRKSNRWSPITCLVSLPLNNSFDPPCAAITCGQTSCPPGFTLKEDASCCGVCHNPDVVLESKIPVTGFEVDQCPTVFRFIQTLICRISSF